MRIKIVNDYRQLMEHFGFQKSAVILEPDIDLIENDCDVNERKRRDAEVLCLVAANAPGKALDLGTSHGRSAYKLATNLGADHPVYTVNILPEQYTGQGEAITHLLTKDQIGVYYREREIDNVVQIYADTTRWEPPPEIDALSVIFVDACHDEDFVYADTRKVYERLAPGGFILWHDFSPVERPQRDWIESVMRGVERFAAEQAVEPEIVHLRGSWVGVLRKPLPAQPSARPAATQDTAPASVSPARRPLRALVGYSVYPYETSVRDSNEAWLGRLRRADLDVTGFCLTLNPPGPCLTWAELNQRWQQREPQLIALYSSLLRELESGQYDLFINYNGINLHPDFVYSLPCFTVYCCFDDPESSQWLSQPVAHAYDLAMVGNIAELDRYRAWGCQRVAWLPMGFRADEYDPALTERDILTRARAVDVAIVCERESPWRRERLDHFARAFPNGQYFGKGWPAGFLPEARKLQLYQQTRIGLNLHNSTGPINYRTFTVPANGGLLLCDNSTRLGQIFELGVEAIGFDYIDEAIAHARFFLSHEPARREIAAAGWRRATRDYNEAAAFRRIFDEVEQARCAGATGPARRAELISGASQLPAGVRAERQHLWWDLDPKAYIDGCILKEGIFEPESTHLYERIARPGMRWLDVGANIGYYTLLLARLTTEFGFGAAFEPTPHLNRRLRHHLALNQLTDRVAVFDFGLSDQARACQIGFNHETASLHWPRADQAPGSAAIQLTRLDEVGLGDRLTAVDLVKIDIDGHEPFLLRGAHQFFTEQRPLICLEFANLNLHAAGESVATLGRELQTLGYELYSEKTGQRYRDEAVFLIECGNYAFSANAWAVPVEVASHFPDLNSLANAIPQNYRDYQAIFMSLADVLRYCAPPGDQLLQLRLSALEGAAVWMRPGTADATVLWDVFHFQFHKPTTPVPATAGAVVDLGCNVGYTTADLAHRFPAARLVAVEMDAANYALALRNTEALGERCAVRNAAIWASDGQVQYAGQSTQGFHIVAAGAGPELQSVPALSLNSLFREHGLQQVEYLKMDIEGAEAAVFRSDLSWLAQVRSLKVEIHHLEDYDWITALLEERGFCCRRERRHYCGIEAVRA